jgi:shikimate kinase
VGPVSLTRHQIYLVGFMGAGKTTAGRDLAGMLGWDFADLDEAICRSQNRSIAEIFAERGEPHFRRVETAVLAQLARVPRLVVATGGGTYVAEENRRLVEAAGWSVWL